MALPKRVLFPIAAPNVDSKAFAAYEEIREDLIRADVQVVSANGEGLILGFASVTDKSAVVDR